MEMEALLKASQWRKRNSEALHGSRWTPINAAGRNGPNVHFARWFGSPELAVDVPDTHPDELSRLPFVTKRRGRRG